MDSYGFEAENTPMGELAQSSRKESSAPTFEGATIDSQFWITAAAGVGAAIAQATRNYSLHPASKHLEQ